MAEGRLWLPATEATVWLYIAHLMSKGTIKAASLQPNLSAINSYHEDMGYDGPAKGRSVSRAVKGMASLQVEVADIQDEEETVWIWLPARYVTKVNAYGLVMQPSGRTEAELSRACTYVVFAFVTFGRPDTGVSVQQSHIAVADDVISVVLHKEKGRGHVRRKRSFTIPAAGVEGLVQLLEHWQLVAADILTVRRGRQGQLLEAALGARSLDVGPGQRLGAAGFGHAEVSPPGGEALLGAQHPQGRLLYVCQGGVWQATGYVAHSLR
eukprot:gene5485-biopygen5487